MLLCDSAQSVAGKLYILGGGWTQVSVAAFPSGFAMALALRVAIPWDRSNERIPLSVTLVTEEGAPVNVSGEAVRATAELEVGRPPGLPRGTPLDANLALNFFGLQLRPGGYAWHCETDGSIKARAAFRVTP